MQWSQFSRFLESFFFEWVPGDIVKTLSPISPSDPMLALASVLMNFCTSFSIHALTTTEESETNCTSSTVPMLIPEKRTLLPTVNPLTFLKFAWMRKVDPKDFFVFQ
jgi:hypothetical protein